MPHSSFYLLQKNAHHGYQGPRDSQSAELSLVLDYGAPEYTACAGSYAIYNVRETMATGDDRMTDDGINIVTSYI